MPSDPAGGPTTKRPITFYHSVSYQAASWEKPRRVVVKIEWRQGQLFPEVSFIVTNLRWREENVVRFYNQRGTVEQWIKEGKYALNWTRLSCHGFEENQVCLQLFVLAYNLANFLRRLALPRAVKHWSLTTLREKLIKIGAKVVTHARYTIFRWPRWPCRVNCSGQSLSEFDGCGYRLRYRTLDDGADGQEA